MECIVKKKKKNRKINVVFDRSTKRIYELLEGYLRHKSDMVNLEAARAICEMKDASAKELYPAISGKFLLICQRKIDFF